jgi:asparagine synthase (glutamine-hydrolysing)
MCSFIFTNRAIEDLNWVNFYSQRRGPDLTNVIDLDGYYLVHNLLSITGRFSPQPFLDGDTLCMYNGQIYGYHELMPLARSDGKCIIPAYREFGNSFASKLDGEFAIALWDREHDRLIATTDSFACKPIWYSREGSEIAVATYRSAIDRLGFKDIRKIPANTTLVFDLSSNAAPPDAITPYRFDLRQYKDSCDDWMDAFDRAVYKRTRDTREKLFIGLSSGYDSGCIAASALSQGIPFRAYSVEAQENREVLSRRLDRIPNHVFTRLKKREYEDTKRHIDRYVEDFVWTDGTDTYRVREDPATRGQAYINQHARADGYKVQLSGQGADEITSDYGIHGEKRYELSTLAGRFPEDLAAIFPWPNVFGGAQVCFINKEECVGGSFGIETRYPFLDREVVQEFLSLTQSVKNQNYKSPLYAYLLRHQFPFDKDRKIGFNANRNLKGKLFFAVSETSKRIGRRSSNRE